MQNNVEHCIVFIYTYPLRNVKQTCAIDSKVSLP